MSTAENTTELPCHLRFDTADFKAQAALRAVIGLFSCACCILVIAIIVLFKKYRFYTQRLILYLAIAAMLHAFSYPLTRVNYYSPRPIEDRYCYFGGLFNHYTAANEVLSVCIMTLNLVVKALFNQSTEKAEPLFVLIIFLLPASWFWVPLWLQAYGTAGGWCTIRTFNSDCSPYRNEPWLQLGLRYIPLYSLMMLTLISIILVAMRTTMMSSVAWVGRWSLQANAATKESVRREIRSLIWYPIIFILLNMFAFANQICSAVGIPPPSVLVYLRIFSSTFRGAFIALAFALDRETRKRLRPAQCKAACFEWVGSKDNIEEFVLSGRTFVESFHSAPYHDASQSL